MLLCLSTDVVFVRVCLVFVSVELGGIMHGEECMMSGLDLLGRLDPAVVTILVFTNIMASHRFSVHLLTGSSCGFLFVRWSLWD